MAYFRLLLFPAERSRSYSAVWSVPRTWWNYLRLRFNNDDRYLTSDLSTHQLHMTCFIYSHMKEEMRAWFELEGSVWGRCCWFDEQAAFRSSKSFLETHESLFCCWFDPRKFFTSFRSSLMTSIASSKEEDSSDAWHDTVGTALTSKDKNVIITQITEIKRKADQRASDMLTNRNYFTSCIL